MTDTVVIKGEVQPDMKYVLKEAEKWEEQVLAF